MSESTSTFFVDTTGVKRLQKIQIFDPHHSEANEKTPINLFAKYSRYALYEVNEYGGPEN